MADLSGGVLTEAGPTDSENINDFSIEQFLAAEQEKDLLRFSTAGSVDDGKSTLIGRLLYDSHNVYEDHVKAVTKQQGSNTSPTIDFAQLTDGLRAEREQGITIDVAYRYFSTSKRKFIIADTPGHEQYTRNMATGASTADLAIILIDARKGILSQSRRHAYIASLLGIPRVVAAINKMDLVDFSEEVFRQHERDLQSLAETLQLRQLLSIPVSALEGDNVVTRSARMPWYQGPSLLEHLESVPAAMQSPTAGFRLPVQYVIRPNQDFRGFAGQIASGMIRVGDPVRLLPSGNVARVKAITTFDGELEEAAAPLSVTVSLDGEFDVSRGDMLASTEASPQVTRSFQTQLVWMNAEALDPAKTYLLKHTTRTVKARVKTVEHRVDINNFETIPTDRLQMNEIGSVLIETSQALFVDPYTENRNSGSFILIDPDHHATVAAGMVRKALGSEENSFEEAQDTAGLLIVAGSALSGSLDVLEERLLDMGEQVVKTRVENKRFWIELLKTGAVVLVASYAASHAALGVLDASRAKVVWEHVPQGADQVEELVRKIHGRNAGKSRGREQ
jgi:sulfate adenylyltransferase large subunit